MPSLLFVSMLRNSNLLLLLSFSSIYFKSTLVLFFDNLLTICNMHKTSQTIFMYLSLKAWQGYLKSKEILLFIKVYVLFLLRHCITLLYYITLPLLHYFMLYYITWENYTVLLFITITWTLYCVKTNHGKIRHRLFIKEHTYSTQRVIPDQTSSEDWKRCKTNALESPFLLTRKAIFGEKILGLHQKALHYNANIWKHSKRNF